MKIHKVDRRAGIPLMILVAVSLILTALLGCATDTTTTTPVAFSMPETQDEAANRIDAITEEFKRAHGPQIADWPEAAQLYWIQLFYLAYPESRSTDFIRPGEAGP